MNKRETGKIYEEKAAAFLKEQGFILLEKNFRCRQGEVDLIGIHENCLVFVEVKYRRDGTNAIPEEAVNSTKQGKICRVSDYYRVQHPENSQRQLRYDVVAICGKEIRWHKNAFFYCRGRSRGAGW